MNDFRIYGEYHSASLAHLNNLRQDPNLTSDQKVDRILALGNTWFQTSFALVSEIEGDLYRVLRSVSDIAVVEPGTEFPLGVTYCVHTLKTARPVAFHAAGQSAISGHPCYNVFQLDTYIGAPLFRGDEIIGTVNFTAVESREPFGDDDLALIGNLALALERLLLC